MRAANRDLFEEKSMPFGDHIEELRTVLMKSLVYIGLGFIVGLMIAKPVIRLIEQPLHRNLSKYLTKRGISKLETKLGTVDAEFQESIARRQLVLREIWVERTVLERMRGDDYQAATPIPVSTELVALRFWEPAKSRLVVLSTTEPFITWLKAAFFCGLIVSAPFVLWQVWTFVGVGLFRHERKVVYTFLPLSLFLFISGAALAFLLVFDPVLEFLFSYAAKLEIELTPRLTDWMSFVLFLPVGFGVAFQLPLVMLAVNRMRIVTIKGYVQHWRTAILVICVMSMILTPQEPISMLAMAVPLTLLYFLGVLLCLFVDRRKIYPPGPSEDTSQRRTL